MSDADKDFWFGADAARQGELTRLYNMLKDAKKLSPEAVVMIRLAML